jgi:hypothetical protein
MIDDDDDDDDDDTFARQLLTLAISDFTASVSTRNMLPNDYNLISYGTEARFETPHEAEYSEATSSTLTKSSIIHAVA